MFTVIVYDKKNIKFLEAEVDKADQTTTVLHIKQRISASDPEALQLSLDGQLLSDDVALSSIAAEKESILVLTLESDVELSEISMSGIEKSMENESEKKKRTQEEQVGAKAMQSPDQLLVGVGIGAGSSDSRLEPSTSSEAKGLVEVVVGGSKMKVKKEDVVEKDGVTYYVTKRQKRLTLEILIKNLQDSINVQFLAQALFFFLIFLTNNLFLLMIILLIRLLNLSSRFVRNVSLWRAARDHFSRSVFMFFASLFLIDHNYFYTDIAASQQMPLN